MLSSYCQSINNQKDYKQTKSSESFCQASLSFHWYKEPWVDLIPLPQTGVLSIELINPSKCGSYLVARWQQEQKQRL
ncbi:hypothetical protein SS1G_07408 [Sclerotinia sclerotiorum 1980 UF-70]|uniref:Uncharacterized protein n=1 Tax=Sclerotinia sclerotiorum (strain ATCC 18683 / 1980 / Ss-1) TaxID=665079 RepID=A7EQ08_SCLS1|nr:hypothetical protein SS1G_07408 [Sclerotinia sclerotiorum 1980 UF-70]EDO04924.1 hypothetical protein SS1G_07408 [Sclerotinia sclerotiorum 1980 UF-70]